MCKNLSQLSHYYSQSCTWKLLNYFFTKHAPIPDQCLGRHATTREQQRGSKHELRPGQGAREVRYLTFTFAWGPSKQNRLILLRCLYYGETSGLHWFRIPWLSTTALWQERIIESNSIIQGVERCKLYDWPSSNFPSSGRARPRSRYQDLLTTNLSSRQMKSRTELLFVWYIQ